MLFPWGLAKSMRRILTCTDVDVFSLNRNCSPYLERSASSPEAGDAPNLDFGFENQLQQQKRIGGFSETLTATREVADDLDTYVSGAPVEDPDTPDAGVHSSVAMESVGSLV